MKIYFFCLFMALMAPAALGMALGGAEDNEGDDAEWLNMLSQSRFEKRKFGPSDPRSLFQAVYSNYK